MTTSQYHTTPSGHTVYCLWNGSVEDAIAKRETVDSKLVCLLILERDIDLISRCCEQWDNLESLGILVAVVPDHLTIYNDQQLLVAVDELIDHHTSRSLKIDPADLRIFSRQTVEDQLVQQWHNGAGNGCQLHEYLGLTWEQYAEWVANPSLFDETLERRMLAMLNDINVDDIS